MSGGEVVGGGVDLEEVRDMSRRSLRFLCKQFLGYVDWDEVHDDLEKFLMKPAVRKAVLLPRGHMKTSVVTIGGSIQALLRDPNVRILIANQVWDRARDILREIKGQLEGSQLKHVFGGFESNRWNEDAIVIRQRRHSRKEPTIMTTGVEAETTGGHYDLIILDDLTGRQNSETHEQREKTKRFRRSMFNLVEPGTRIWEVGTRWHLDDTFSEVLGKESKYYDVMVRKVVEGGRVIFPKKFSKRFNEKYKDWEASEGMSLDYVEYLKASMPAGEFSAQYLNNPIDEENQIFRKPWFQYFKQRPEGLYVGMTVDAAISERVTSDETAIVVTGMDEGGNIYVLDVVHGRWGVSGILDNVIQKADQWRVNVCGLETIGFQRTLKYALEQRMKETRKYVPIVELKTPVAVEAKAYRIKALEPLYRGGKVFHAEWMKEGAMEEQLLTFPKGAHDDIIDALAYSLQVLIPGKRRAESRDVASGSWEWWARMARQGNFHKRFLDHI